MDLEPRTCSSRGIGRSLRSGRPTGGSAVTDRAGGLGGDDLWLSRREGGTWGELVHLGDAVNTPEYEYGPYIHDGWLYFTSHRDGQADIYRIPVQDVPGLER